MGRDDHPFAGMARKLHWDAVPRQAPGPEEENGWVPGLKARTGKRKSA